MGESRATVKNLLSANCLTQKWLINRLKQSGLESCSTELSSVLAGRRKGKKAELLIATSLQILTDYQSTNIAEGV